MGHVRLAAEHGHQVEIAQRGLQERQRHLQTVLRLVGQRVQLIAAAAGQQPVDGRAVLRRPAPSGVSNASAGDSATLST
jgi:hypothetical protein